MADGKKSFVLYCDLIHTVEYLDDALAGKLLKHLLKYVNDENPETDDLLLKVAFEPIKRQLKRDLLDWEASVVKRSDAGVLGNLKRWHLDIYKQVVAGEITIEKAAKIAKHRKASQSDKCETGAIPIVANIAVTDTVTVTDTVSREIPKERKSNIVVEKETNDSFFYFFRRAAGSHISDTELRQEVGKFRNKYPNVHVNQSGALINAWVSNIGKEKTSEKKMVL